MPGTRVLTVRGLVLLAAAALLTGCVYDPYTGAYYPCCSYTAYPPYSAPAYGYPAYGYPAYGHGAYPFPPHYLPQAGYQRIPSDDASSLDRRFQAANVTRDGRLTLEQAKAAGWDAVARDFSSIDIGQKGYVTLNDVRVWAAAHPGETGLPAG